MLSYDNSIYCVCKRSFSFIFILSFFDMFTGVIKAIERFRAKGFGFITPSEGGEDIFFHFSGVEGGNDGYVNLRENDMVQYNLTTGRDGKTKAVDVKVVAGHTSQPAANDDDYDASEVSHKTTHPMGNVAPQKSANDDDYDQEEAA